MCSNEIKIEKAGEEMAHKLKTIRADMLVLQCQLERLTIKSQARNAEERQKFRRFKRGIAKLTSFWTPT